MGNIISVAGNVGVGKSTFCEAVSDALGAVLETEPIAQNPFLDDFYQDMMRWGFHNQLKFLESNARIIEDIRSKTGLFVQDRTVLEAVEVFVSVLVDQGILSKREFDLYHGIADLVLKPLNGGVPDLLVYLEGDLDDIVSRVQKRGRPGEVKTDRAYWEKLYRRYERWIESYEKRNLSPVLRIPISSYDLKADPDAKYRLADMIRPHLTTTGR